MSFAMIFVSLGLKAFVGPPGLANMRIRPSFCQTELKFLTFGHLPGWHSHMATVGR